MDRNNPQCDRIIIVLCVMALIMPIAITFGSYHVFKDKKRDVPVLTVYHSQDIFYIDIERSHIGSETGRVDTTFADLGTMAAYLDEMTAREQMEGTNDAIQQALNIAEAEVGLYGIRIVTVDPYTGGEIRVTLDTVDDTIFYSSNNK